MECAGEDAALRAPGGVWRAGGVSLFSTREGEVEIRFYDRPCLPPDAVRVSLRYSGKADDVDVLARHFEQYYDAVLASLGHSVWRSAIEHLVAVAVARGLGERTDVLHTDDHWLRLVPETSGFVKRCYARFLSERPAVVRLYGGAVEYGSLTVAAFLQSLTDALAPLEWERLTEHLAAHLGEDVLGHRIDQAGTAQASRGT
jgi:hypothetical protein